MMPSPTMSSLALDTADLGDSNLSVKRRGHRLKARHSLLSRSQPTRGAERKAV